MTRIKRGGGRKRREVEVRDLLGKPFFERIFEHGLEHYDDEGVFWWEDDLTIALGLKEVEYEEVPEP
jgi:hypothetical protein